jgi:hypothetical protein
MYGTPHSLNTMNGMGGEVVDGSGTIDPANLSNSGMLCCLPVRSVIRPLSRLGVQSCFYRDLSFAQTPTPTRAHNRFFAICPRSRARIFP